MSTVDHNLLRSIPLFALMDDSELKLLADQLDQKKYLAGQIIFETGQAGNDMYILTDGEVEIFVKDDDDERVQLELVKDSGIFGELSLLDNDERSASCIALRNSSVLIVDRNDLEILFKVHPHAALDILTTLGRRLRDSNRLLRSRVTRNVNQEVPISLTFGERLSDFLTSIAGNVKFVYFSFAWFFIWIVLNTNILPGVKAFDPFPFGLLTMVVSLEAIFLSLFVLISQNRQAQRDKVRNDIEYEVNLKAEIEIRSLTHMVEKMQELMVQHFSEINTVQEEIKLSAMDLKASRNSQSGAKPDQLGAIWDAEQQ